MLSWKMKHDENPARSKHIQKNENDDIYVIIVGVMMEKRKYWESESPQNEKLR